VDAPEALKVGHRVELSIPLIGRDHKTGSVRYDDVPGREPSPQIDYAEFEKYYEKSTSPKTFP
jgi:hypothetical protein